MAVKVELDSSPRDPVTPSGHGVGKLAFLGLSGNPLGRGIKPLAPYLHPIASPGTPSFGSLLTILSSLFLLLPSAPSTCVLPPSLSPSRRFSSCRSPPHQLRLLCFWTWTSLVYSGYLTSAPRHITTHLSRLGTLAPSLVGTLANTPRSTRSFSV